MKNKKFNDDKFNDDLDDDMDELPGEQPKGSKKKGPSEFEQLLEQSFKEPQKKLSVGDKIQCELLAVGTDEVFFSMGASGSAGIPLDGTAPRKELLNAEGNFEHRVGDLLDLYITKIRGTKISLSTSPVPKSQAEDLADAYRAGLPIEGKITEVCNGGVRVSIKGKSAFCPISQIDIVRVENAEEYVGQKFDFLISQINEGGRNIVVSRRKLLQSQRTLSEGAFTKEKKEGDVVTGKVKKLEPFGAFVEIAPGIEGLLHISEMSWSRVNNPKEVVHVGQEVRVKIIKSETKENRLRISLSMKQVEAEPWSNLSQNQNIREGLVVEGKVIRCMKFGAFVEVAPGIEGLVPLSEMSFTKRVVRSDELFKEGDRITVMVKEINPETKRILLSLRDAGSDPWALVPHKYPVGAVVSGKVEKREPFGVFIQLEEGITGLLPKSKANANPEFPYDKLKTGESVMVQIGEVNTDDRKISLNVPQDPNQDEWKNHVSPTSAGPKAKLADKFKNIVLKK